MSGVQKLIGVIAKENSGIITTTQVEVVGVSRAALKHYVDEEQLIRVCKGLYVLEGGIADEYTLLQARSEKVLYPYGTALLLWDLSDRVPHTIDLIVPHGTSIGRIERDNPRIRFHYVQSPLFGIGGLKLSLRRAAQYDFMTRSAVSVI